MKTNCIYTKFSDLMGKADKFAITVGLRFQAFPLADNHSIFYGAATKS